ncbi:MAG: hypothetical protein ACLFTK_13525 [Anaerolineales bacterium]
MTVHPTNTYIAQKYLAAQPDAEVMGNTVLGFTLNVLASEIGDILKKYDIEEIDPNTWYSQQIFLDAYRDIVGNMQNATERLVAIGKATMESVEFPREVQTPQAAIKMLHETYQMLHRNVPPSEGWDVIEHNPNHLEVLFNAPYADGAAFGYLYTIANRLKPAGMTATVHPLPTPEGEIPRFEIILS